MPSPCLFLPRPYSYSIKELKKAAIKFFRLNKSEVSEQDDFADSAEYCEDTHREKGIRPMSHEVRSKTTIILL